MLAIDGVYAADDDGQPQFQALLAPEDQEIARLTASLAERIPKWLQRRGLGPVTYHSVRKGFQNAMRELLPILLGNRGKVPPLPSSQSECGADLT